MTQNADSGCVIHFECDRIPCTAKWLYRGRTRAKCYDVAGHEGRHWNGTVKWSDSTPGAVPHRSET